MSSAAAPLRGPGPSEPAAAVAGFVAWERKPPEEVLGFFADGASLVRGATRPTAASARSRSAPSLSATPVNIFDVEIEIEGVDQAEAGPVVFPEGVVRGRDDGKRFEVRQHAGLWSQTA
jgi:hypothetical protein